MGERGHPCQTPTVVRDQFPMLLLKRAALVALPQRFFMTPTPAHMLETMERELILFAASSRETLWAEAGVAVGLVAAETIVQTRVAGAFVDI